jgi:membrane protease YdiL (CAAX protease family)
MVSAKTRIKFTRAVVAELGALLILLLIAFGLSILVLIPFFFGELSENESLIISQGFESILVIIILQISYLLVFFWRYRDYKEKIGLWESAGKKYPWFALLGLGVVAGLAVWTFNYLHDLVVVNFLSNNVSIENPWFALENIPKTYRIIFYLVGISAIPVCEELFFRRMMFGNILRRGFTKTAYVFSVLIFAFFHLDFPNILIYLVYGFVFALLYHQTRSLVPSITAHIVLNAIALTYLLF